MPNPGVFRSQRKAWLLAEINKYKNTITLDQGNNTLLNIIHHFFKCFPVSLPLGQDPTPKALAQVNDFTADPERPPPPDLAVVGCLQKIKNFLHYQINKTCSATDTGGFNPYTAAFKRMLGIAIPKPHHLAGHNIWCRTHGSQIQLEVEHVVALLAVGKTKNTLTISDGATCRLYGKLTDEEKALWVRRAEKEHREVLAVWERDTTMCTSKDPADHQRALELAPKFLTPILNMLEDTTGWKWQVQGGGPEPADGGRLNVMSVSSGTMMGPAHLTFVQAQRDSYRKYVLPVWSTFLCMCYSPEQCWDSALPETGLTIAELGLEEGQTILETAEGGPQLKMPQWVQSAVDMLQSEELGPEWTELVMAWEKFKEANFVSAPTLISTHRPACVTDWIQCARTIKFRPKLTTRVDKLEKDFTAWFNLLRDDVRRSGKNGFLSILAVLFFWSDTLTKTRGEHAVCGSTGCGTGVRKGVASTMGLDAFGGFSEDDVMV
ncbi:hypothetical protein DXG01_001129 [Tephrocybe rancida]|nr:hypothetical protein DXG01_001129 [Tephrocybe rancida]